MNGHVPAEPGIVIDRASKPIEDLVGRCTQIIRSAARRFSLSDADTDELTQEIRLRLWNFQRRAGQPGELPSPSYVYTAAMSASMDLLRRQRSTRLASHRSLDEISEVTSGASITSTDALAAAMDAALARVPISRRPIVRLHLSGYDLNEIARVTGNSLNSSRNLLYRGLSDLRTALEEADR